MSRLVYTERLGLVEATYGDNQVVAERDAKAALEAPGASKLIAGSCTLSEEAMELLANHTSLRRFSVDETQQWELAGYLARNTSIRDLSLVTHGAVQQYLQNAKKGVKIEKLNISYNGIIMKDVRTLAKFTSLAKLKINGNRLKAAMRFSIGYKVTNSFLIGSIRKALQRCACCLR